MSFNLIFTILGLPFLTLLVITLFFKKKFNNVRSKFYLYMIIISFLYSITEIVQILK